MNAGIAAAVFGALSLGAAAAHAGRDGDKLVLATYPNQSQVDSAISTLRKSEQAGNVRVKSRAVVSRSGDGAITVTQARGDDADARATIETTTSALGAPNAEGPALGEMARALGPGKVGLLLVVGDRWLEQTAVSLRQQKPLQVLTSTVEPDARAKP